MVPKQALFQEMLGSVHRSSGDVPAPQRGRNIQHEITDAGLDLSRAIDLLRQSMEAVPRLHAAIRQKDLEEAAAFFRDIAQAEEQAYLELEGELAI
jgi:hypothetical protein